MKYPNNSLWMIAKPNRSLKLLYKIDETTFRNWLVHSPNYTFEKSPGYCDRLITEWGYIKAPPLLASLFGAE